LSFVTQILCNTTN